MTLSTLIPSRDASRLARQLALVRAAMSDGQPHTLAELARAASCSTASASARVRDLRKPRYGAHTVSRTYIDNGVWEYAIVPASVAP